MNDTVNFLRTVSYWCRSHPDKEQAGFCFTKHLEGVFFTREFMEIPHKRLFNQTNNNIMLDPLSIIWACRKACAMGSVLFIFHTHPLAKDPVSFSDADTRAEKKMALRVMSLGSQSFFGSVVVGRNSYMARVWNISATRLQDTPVEILETC